MNDEFAYSSSTQGLKGWVSKELKADQLTELLDESDHLLNVSSSRVLRNSQKLLVVKQTLTAPEGRVWNIVIKRFQHTSCVRCLGYFFLPSLAVRSLRSALALKGRGVDTPRPLAALEYRRWQKLGVSYYVAEEIVDGQSLSAFWRDVVPTFSGENALKKKRQILAEVAALFHKLHSRGIYHGDLKGSNILIREREPGVWQCFLVDVDSVRKTRCLGWLRRIKNLVQLCSSAGRYFDPGEKAFFLNYYSDLFSLSDDRRKALATKVSSMSRNYEAGPLQKRAKQAQCL